MALFKILKGVKVYINSSGLAKTCTMAASGNWFDALTSIGTDGVCGSW